MDIICGGSPCQDLSVAGTRAGLAGARSGLFMEQIRIVREMRNADILRGRTGIHVRPRMLCWENVPGAFSSGKRKGEDFRIVLEETPELVYQESCLWKITLGMAIFWGSHIGRYCLPMLASPSTLNTGVSPRVVRGSSCAHLGAPSSSQNTLLSRKACLGILRRARKRGKQCCLLQCI